MSLANTEDTEIIINELTSEIPETGFFALGPDNYHEYTKELTPSSMSLQFLPLKPLMRLSKEFVLVPSRACYMTVYTRFFLQ